MMSGTHNLSSTILKRIYMRPLVLSNDRSKISNPSFELLYVNMTEARSRHFSPYPTVCDLGKV